MLQNGTIINDTYKIIGQIGAGGGGIVYKAEHLRLNIDVVVKQIRDEIKGKVALRQEADVLKRLKHPYLPRVYDFIETGEGIFTVMDFISGQGLDKLLKENTSFPQKQVLKWAEQLAEALAYLHSQNPPIIHSDIKPANIIITPENNICLIDFNIAMTFDESLKSSIGISVCYSPPEQYGNYAAYQKIINRMLLSKKTEDTQTLLPENVNIKNRVGENIFGRNDRIDTKSDIYSLGCVLYHMLTGFSPDMEFEKIVPLSQTSARVSEGLALIIEKMMQLEAKDRYRDGQEACGAIRNCYKMDRRYIAQHRKEKGLLFVSGFFLLVGAVLIGSGIRQIELEKEQAYQQVILHADELSGLGEYEDALKQIEQLETDYAEKPEAYERELFYYYLQENYDECLRRANEILALTIWDSDTNKEILGNIYCIMANTCYEKQDYEKAVFYIENAITCENKNVLFYRDYCVFLAKDGNLDEAIKVKEEAEQLGITEDSLCLISGEIHVLQGEYEEAIEDFKRAISLTAEADVQRRAVLLCADAMTNAEDIEGAIVFLEEAKKKCKQEIKPFITEKLASVYLQKAASSEQKEDSYKKALSLYVLLREEGYGTFQTLENIAVLHENLGDLSEAEEVLSDMLDKYPQNYKVYKRLALLEADKQQYLENTKRNYQLMYDYFIQAKELYSKEKTEDSEMIFLNNIVQDLKLGGWLEK